MTPADGFREIHVGNNEDLDDDDGGGKHTCDISIDGKGVATIDAHSNDRMFHVGEGSSLSITGVTLQNGRRTGVMNNWGGAIYVHSGHLELDGCTFKNNSVPVQGGGDGGAVFIAVGSAAITDCTFDGNTASGGGAVFTIASASATIISSKFMGGAGSHTDSVLNNYDNGRPTILFACPSTSTGLPVNISKEEEFAARQLPPATEVVHCVPKLPQ
jgi:hypothetical protein